VFQNRHVPEQLDILESPDKSTGGEHLGRHSRYILALQVYRPRCLAVNAGNDIEKGRFPCAVRTYDARNVPFAGVEGNVLQGGDAAESLGKLPYFKHRPKTLFRISFSDM